MLCFHVGHLGLIVISEINVTGLFHQLTITCSRLNDEKMTEALQGVNVLNWYRLTQ